MGIAAILQLITALEPGIVNTIVAIRNKANGSIDVLAVLDSADTQLAANQQQIAAWMSAHGKAPTP